LLGTIWLSGWFDLFFDFHLIKPVVGIHWRRPSRHACLAASITAARDLVAVYNYSQSSIKQHREPVDFAESERHAERIDGGVFVKYSCRGKLCSRINHSLHD
jgi:hypothetical protein